MPPCFIARAVPRCTRRDARPDSLRFALQVVTIVFLGAYLGWTVQVLWR